MICGTVRLQFGELVRLDPKAHGVLAGAEDLNAGDTVTRVNLVDQIDVRVIGQKNVVVECRCGEYSANSISGAVSDF